MRIILAGATGLIGGLVLDRLLARPEVASVLVMTRRATGRTHPKLVERLAPLADWPGIVSLGHVDVVISALGTTQKKTPDQAAYEAVDLEAVLALAAAALKAGATHFLTVSSIGATSASGNFYLRTKGRMEDGLRALPFSRLDIFRPGLLRGPRAESRPGERLWQIVQGVLDPLLVGGLKKYRSIPAQDVADAIIACMLTGANGVFVHDYAAMQAKRDLS